jgi:hypothetical protein
MTGYLTDFQNVSAGSTTVTGPISSAALESPLEALSNDTSHDGAMYLIFTCPLTFDRGWTFQFHFKTNLNLHMTLSGECQNRISKMLTR